MTARRRLLLSGALLGMHACWFYAWTTMLEGAASAPVRVAHAIILVLICAVVWRFALDRMRLHPLARHAAYWVLWPVVAALVAKSLLYSGEPWLHSGWVTALPGAPVSLFFEPKISELLILLGTGAAWYVGQRQALRAPDYGRLLADFQFGLAMLLVAFLIGYGFDIEPEHPLLLTLAFFGLGIGSITIARSAGESTAGTLSRGQLSVAVVGSICAVCLAALLMASVMRPEVLDAALSVIRYAGSLVGRSIAYIASLLPTPEHAGAGAPAAAAGADDSALTEWYRSLPVPAMMRRVLFVLWVSVIGGTLLLALWRLCEQVLEWLRRRRSPLEGAVLESTGKSLWSELATLAAWFAQRIRRAFSRLLQRLGLRSNGAAPTGIDLYLALIRWTGRKVLPRDPWQSPYEYLSSLQPLMPAAAEDLHFVTSAYVSERYGGRPADGDTRADMTAAVRRITHSSRKR